MTTSAIGNILAASIKETPHIWQLVCYVWGCERKWYPGGEGCDLRLKGEEHRQTLLNE